MHAAFWTARDRAKYLLFDLDGTLADTVPGLRVSIAKAFAQHGRAIPDVDLRARIGPDIRTILKGLDPAADEPTIASMARVFRSHYDAIGVQNSNLFDSVRDTLALLKEKGFRLFVITNKPTAATTRLLAQFGIEALFSGVICRDSREPPFSSKTEMLQALVDAHAIPLTESVMIGDTDADHIAANDLGLPFIFAAYGYGRPAPWHCLQIGSVSELPSVLATDAQPVPATP